MTPVHALQLRHDAVCCLHCTLTLLAALVSLQGHLHTSVHELLCNTNLAWLV